MDPTWLGIPLEGWFVITASALGWGFVQSMKVWDHYHPIKMSWCQGCDSLQPSACFRWNTIGLYRCGNCLSSPPLLDQAKQIQTAQSALLTGDYGCFKIHIETGRK